MFLCKKILGNYLYNSISFKCVLFFLFVLLSVNFWGRLSMSFELIIVAIIKYSRGAKDNAEFTIITVNPFICETELQYNR
jgi:hypothetical protein